MGVGACVVNAHGQVLVVQERGVILKSWEGRSHLSHWELVVFASNEDIIAYKVCHAEDVSKI